MRYKFDESIEMGMAVADYDEMPDGVFTGTASGVASDDCITVTDGGVVDRCGSLVCGGTTFLSLCVSFVALAYCLSDGVYAMGWIATAIGTGLSVLSSLYGGHEARKQAKKADAEISSSRRKNDAWFRRRYNEHYADTAAGQNLIRKANDFARSISRKARGQQRVAGATDSAAAQAKQQGVDMMGNTLSTLAANDTARKQAADNSYRTRDAQLSAQYIQNQQRKAAQTQYAASQASNALINAGAIVDTAGGAAKAAKAATTPTTLSMDNYSKAGNVINSSTGTVLNPDGTQRHLWDSEDDYDLNNVDGIYDLIK